MADGGFIVADGGATTGPHERIFSVVRRVLPSGRIVRAAGTGLSGYRGDGGPALAARIDASDVSATSDGGFLIAQGVNNIIRRVSPAGTITTVAGSGRPGGAGDGGPATAAKLNDPANVDESLDGGFLIAEAGGHRVRRVSSDGTITTVAGTGAPGTSPDGELAVAARTRSPYLVAAMADGGFAYAEATDSDFTGVRVRRVGPDGRVTTLIRTDFVSGLATTGTGAVLITTFDRILELHPPASPIRVGGSRCGYRGDGGPADRARFAQISDLAPASDGSVLVADADNNRIRRIGPDGTVTTVAGGAGDSTPTPCPVQADPSYDKFQAYGISRRARGRRVVVQFAVTLRANVTAMILRKGKRATSSRNFEAGPGTLRLKAPGAGRYTVRLIARHRTFGKRVDQFPGHLNVR